MRRLSSLLVVALSACTVINTAQVPSDRSGKDIFLTAGDIPEPYESLGLVQVSRTGPLFFGFLDPVGTDLQAGFSDTLIPQIRAMGGDGAINVRFHQTQLPPGVRVVLAIFFFIPVGTNVTVTGEVVKLRHQPPA